MSLGRCDSGTAFDGGIRPLGAGWLGRRYRARCCGRAGAAGGMVRLVRAARGRSSFRSHRIAMVAARTRDCIVTIRLDGAGVRCSPGGGWLESATAPRKRNALREILAFAFEASLMRGQAQQTAITRRLFMRFL